MSQSGLGTILVLAVVAGGIAYAARSAADEPDHPTDPDDPALDPDDPALDPEDPPPVPGLPTPDPADVCSAPLASPAAEAILIQLPEPYRCQARTTIASDPYWRTNLETAALGAESIGLDAIAELLRALTALDADKELVTAWPTTIDLECPGAVMQIPEIEDLLARLPASYRCDARDIIARAVSPAEWSTLLARFSLAIRMSDPAAADVLARLAARGASQ